MDAYWETVCSQDGLKNASDVMPQEVPEILNLLPQLHGLHVLEIGACNGLYTKSLSASARKVFVVDYKKQPLTLNNTLPNVDAQYGDVRELPLQEHGYDLLFTNWLMMHLGDAEVKQLCEKFLRSTNENGHLFIRESCFQAHGTLPTSRSGVHYRTPAQYNALFQSASIPDAEGTGFYGFNLVLCRAIQAHIKVNKNSNQICWLLQKTHIDQSQTGSFRSFQEFLDSHQYTINSIYRYERVFGKNFVSTGGLQTTQEFVPMLDLQQGQTILDVGCGIGGSAFYMTEHHDVTVVGVDLSNNMIDIALERANEINNHRVQFEVGDATKRNFPAESFDVVYSRDTILHISDKLALFTKFHTWLKPGGKVLITDYCCSAEEHTEGFKEYVKLYGYNLLSPMQYGQVLADAGFTNVKALDKTEQFVDILEREITETEHVKDTYIKDFGQDDYDHIVDGWRAKVKRCGDGDQKWGLFYAEKAME